MSELTTQFMDWMQIIPPLAAYAVLLLIAYGENVLPPIPGDVLVVFCGYLAGIGRLHIVAVVALATVGGTLGFMTMFLLGERLDTAVHHRKKVGFIPISQIDRVTGWLHRHGYAVVAVNRFLSGARSVISIAAGMARMNRPITAAWATFSSFIWTALLSIAGYYLGTEWTLIIRYMQLYGKFMLLGAVVAFALWFFVNRFRNARNG